jgi:hypothetical protein
VVLEVRSQEAPVLCYRLLLTLAPQSFDLARTRDRKNGGGLIALPVYFSSDPLRQIATGFVSGGAKVYIASRDAEACKATSDELNALGPGTCQYIQTNLQNIEDIERLAAALMAKEEGSLLPPF